MSSSSNICVVHGSVKPQPKKGKEEQEQQQQQPKKEETQKKKKKKNRLTSKNNPFSRSTCEGGINDHKICVGTV